MMWDGRHIVYTYMNDNNELDRACTINAWQSLNLTLSLWQMKELCFVLCTKYIYVYIHFDI